MPAGRRGFPNLTDGDWLYGGDPKRDRGVTIANGRIGVMPALGAALGEEGTEQVTQYVLSLSGAAEDRGRGCRGPGQVHAVLFCLPRADRAGRMPRWAAPNLTDGYLAAWR